MRADPLWRSAQLYRIEPKWRKWRASDKVCESADAPASFTSDVWRLFGFSVSRKEEVEKVRGTTTPTACFSTCCNSPSSVIVCALVLSKIFIFLFFCASNFYALFGSPQWVEIKNCSMCLNKRKNALKKKTHQGTFVFSRRHKVRMDVNRLQQARHKRHGSWTQGASKSGFDVCLFDHH